MSNIYEKSKIYKFPETDYSKIIHTERIEAELLILIKLDLTLQPELVEMLDKMTAALKIERIKLEYLVFNNVIALSELVSDYKASKVLVFGAEAEDLGLNMDLALYTQYNFNEYSLLLANNLMDVYGNQNLKSKLWNVLKEMFS